MLRYDDNRPENIRSVIGWTVFLLLIGYVAINAVVPNNDVNIGVDVLISVMALMALVYYGGRAARAIWTGSRLNTDFLIVGVALSWFSQSGQASYRIVARLSNLDPAWVNSEIPALLKMGSVIAAVLHVVPDGAVDGNVPKASRFAVVGFFALAAVLALGILSVRPDVKPMIDRMPGWSRDLFRTGQAPTPGAPG